MAQHIKPHEQFWAALAHFPIITMIWIGYILYKFLPTMTIGELLSSINLIETSSLPITPLIMTVASIPIVLSIRWMQKRSHFVKENTAEAFRFNLWLLKHYAVFFGTAILGFCIPSNTVVYIAAVLSLGSSIICLQQCTWGVIVAVRGKVYRYWYPWSFLCLGSHTACQCGRTT